MNNTEHSNAVSYYSLSNEQEPRCPEMVEKPASKSSSTVFKPTDAFKPTNALTKVSDDNTGFYNLLTAGIVGVITGVLLTKGFRSFK